MTLSDSQPDDALAPPAPAAMPLDRKLTVSLPDEVVRQLRRRMGAEETTIRALLLEALEAAGYAVPATQIRDRRRRRRPGEPAGRKGAGR